MKLVIIEGVGKKDTIKKYLGNDYEVVATKGHVRDLPTNLLGVNVLENFKPQYTIMADKKDIVKMLKSKSATADKIYLATDPDREGEAISWHLCNILNLDENSPIRIVFNEISKNAVTHAIENPRGIDHNLVDAQQARRVLDRLVGYKISPILCKKIQPKLSAGRVQSVTLKLVVDRENAIKNFVKEEYWTLVAKLFKDIEFKSNLVKFKGKKYVPVTKDETDNVIGELKKGNFIVKSVKKSLQKSHPYAPYTTSTMQQDALNKLNMNLKKVTSCAQSLYEGVTIEGEGKVALVTYIRTDSVRISPEALNMARTFILNNFGEKYLPKNANFYKVKKSAQDAHEAIRPISLDRTPEQLKDKLSPDNYKLYRLIYNRFLASQMTDATYNSVVVEIANGDYEFKSSGKTPAFDGYMRLFNTTKKVEETEENDEDGENANLPNLTENDLLELRELIPTQKFTKPLPRYTEATLVKEMEDKGIGRPATYTPTITLLSSRKYIDKDGKYLFPTELGISVDELLGKYFSKIIDVKFTADMESKLDEVASLGIPWQTFVKDFYDDFVPQLKFADKDSVRIKVEPKPTNEICDKCGSPMVIRTGKFGEFMACSNYPNCKNIKSMQKIVAVCPKCGGNVIERKSKKGSIFYGCSNYPKCDFVSWEIPIEEKCPKCNSYLTKKEIYNSVRKKCSNTKCDYVETIKKEKSEKK